MNMSTFTWFRIHSFTGVVTGLMLFVICWSGTFAVIAHELDWLVTPEVRIDNSAPLATWGEMKRAVETAYPDATVTWMRAPNHAYAATQILVDRPHHNYVWVYVDPHTTDVLGHYSYFNVQRFFRSFHMSLFDVGGVGYWIVMAFSLTLLASIVSALVFFKRWWRRFVTPPRGRGRALWSGVHKSIGLWSLWFLTVITLTGVWYLAEMVRSDFGDGKTSYAGDPGYAIHEIPGATSDPSLPVLPLDTLVEKAQHARPDLNIRSIFLSESVVECQGQSGHVLVRDRANQVHLDRRSGKVLYDQSASDLPPLRSR